MHKVVLLGLIFTTAGCIPTVRESFMKNGMQRVVFELQCPAEQIQLTGLNRPLDDSMEFAAQVGVTGCGKRVVYVYAHAGWVLNGTTETTGK